MKNILSLSIFAGLATAYSGDLTYYTAGVGSCGITNTGSEAIVALSAPMVCIFRTKSFQSRTIFGGPRQDLGAIHGFQYISDKSRFPGFCLEEGKLTPRLS